MSTINPADRRRIEHAIDRSLTEEELTAVQSFDALRDDQVAVVAELQPNSQILPTLFLRAVVPTAQTRDIHDFIDNIQDVYVVRFPPPELPDQRIFEHYAGRPLLPAERVRAGTVYKMTSEQNLLLAMLAKKDVAVAFLYLSHVAADDPIEVRHHVVKEAVAYTP